MVVFSLSISILLSWSGGGALVIFASTAFTKSLRFDANIPKWSPGLYSISLRCSCVLKSHRRVTRPDFASSCSLTRSFSLHGKTLRECSLLNTAHNSLLDVEFNFLFDVSTGVKRTLCDDHKCSSWSFDNESMNALSV